MTEETWGVKLRRLRTAAGKTQRDLSEEIGRTVVTIANWEHDRNRMPASVMPLVARTLAVSIEELTGEGR